MRAVAALLDSRAALGALRRTLPRGAAPVAACRSVKGLELALRTRLLEAIVLGAAVARQLSLEALRTRFPNIPIVVFGVLRSEDAELLLSWQRLAVAAVAIEGVDDPVIGDLVVRESVSARRAAALAEVPRLLRLSEPLQRKTWELLVAEFGRPPRTATLARSLRLSREHLSRQFGAGGAPNLKRVADLLTVHAALSLLGNPGYSVPAVAGLLDFGTPSHLRLVVKRITGLGVEEARGLGERDVLGRFLRMSARTRR
ncbi:MAG TPA: AraC family transcriptional regulator [Gemmatimonadales bacterium]|jgi:AraC-like DNA-binding protein|nr:AraC family transcriptional regulator [Gemmatimonadales bacterium]